MEKKGKRKYNQQLIRYRKYRQFRGIFIRRLFISFVVNSIKVFYLFIFILWLDIVVVFVLISKIFFWFVWLVVFYVDFMQMQNVWGCVLTFVVFSNRRPETIVKIEPSVHSISRTSAKIQLKLTQALNQKKMIQISYFFDKSSLECGWCSFSLMKF